MPRTRRQGTASRGRAGPCRAWPPLGDGAAVQLGVDVVERAADLCVRGDEDGATVARREQDLFSVGSVKLAEARGQVAVVQHRPPVLVDLVKDKVAKEDEEVLVARLAPRRVAVAAGAVEECESEVNEQAQQTPSADLGGDVALQHVGRAVSGVKLVKRSPTEHVAQREHRGRLGQELDDEGVQLARVVLSHGPCAVHCHLRVAGVVARRLRVGLVPRRQSQDEAAQRHHVVALRVCHAAPRVGLEHVHDAHRPEAHAPARRHQHASEADRPHSQARRVHDAHRRHELQQQSPERRLWQGPKTAELRRRRRKVVL
mmetsp:Transcript_16470/g.57469  ORF Transcript_16470/g.57469 Transcript_16470/m.57469 type:complete len:315 (+) Transcript_16470:74-1018(+)